MEEVQKHLFVLILAGGGGTRLWPMSTERYPKQYLKLFGNRSLLQSTYDRAKMLTEISRIWIATTQDQVHLIKRQLPKHPLSNYSIEPQRKNTAWSQGLGAAYILNQDPQAIIVNLASDHLIHDLPTYIKTLRAASLAAWHTGKIITVGITPTFHHTGYEYIHFGQNVGKYNSLNTYKVKGFLRRDEDKKIAAVLKKKTGLWNANNYVWLAGSLLSEYKKLQPRVYSGLMRIKDEIGSDKEKQVKQQVFQMAESIQIDFIFTGHSQDMLTIPGNFSWTDVGDWGVVWDKLPKDKLGNVISGPHGKGQYLGIDSENNLLFLEKKLVATAGIKDMVIVDTPDALLICPKDYSQGVKRIVQALKDQGLAGFV